MINDTFGWDAVHSGDSYVLDIVSRQLRVANIFFDFLFPFYLGRFLLLTRFNVAAEQHLFYFIKAKNTAITRRRVIICIFFMIRFCVIKESRKSNNEA